MLQRFDNWYTFFGISAKETQQCAPFVQRATDLSAGMLAAQDYDALAAALLHLRPKNIFEIGTHFGATADFMLNVSPRSRVISLEYFPDDDIDAGFSSRPARMDFDQIGTKLSSENRPRFTQIIGEANLIVARDFVARQGGMDFVFVSGEANIAAMATNTALAQKVINARGAIAWHGANPKRKYGAIRAYLEKDLALSAMATADTYIGGVALWSPEIAARLVAKAA